MKACELDPNETFFPFFLRYRLNKNNTGVTKMIKRRKIKKRSHFGNSIFGNQTMWDRKMIINAGLEK